MSLSGHLWTVAPRWWRRQPAPTARRWSMTVEDARYGGVELTGLLREEPGARELLVVLHGIGGCAEAVYARRAAEVAASAGLSCLRLNQRGSDRSGNDYYHAGLTADLHHALGSPELAGYEAVYLLGYSLGGHIVLRYASGAPPASSGTPGCGVDPRLQAVAAICPPLDLALSNRAIDSPRLWPYRRFVLANLFEIYRAVAARREVPVPVAEAAKIRTLFEWDDRLIAPRWGFADAPDYYRRASVAPYLAAIERPALVVASENDPMVPEHTLRPVLEATGAALEVAWVDRGGHVTFPANLELGVAAPPGLDQQVLGWLRKSWLGDSGGVGGSTAAAVLRPPSVNTGQPPAKEM
jgi:hypothetical protein